MQAFGVAQEWRDQHHHLVDAAADVELAGFALAMAHGIEIEPERRHQHDVFGCGADLVGTGAEDAGGGKPAHHTGGVFRGALEDSREVQAQLAIA